LNPANELKAWQQKAQAQTELLLERFLPSENQVPHTLHEAMRYVTLGGGKRRRRFGNPELDGEKEQKQRAILRVTEAFARDHEREDDGNDEGGDGLFDFLAAFRRKRAPGGGDVVPHHVRKFPAAFTPARRVVGFCLLHNCLFYQVKKSNHRLLPVK